MTQIAYEATVSSLLSQGVPEAKAIARARELYPDVAAQLDAQAVRNARVAETREQLRIKQMAIAVGFKVYSLSQARAAKQTPGLPDLWMYRDADARYERPIAFWWESKRQVGGERSSAQIAFAAECEAAGIPYGFGDRYHFAEFLRARGITPPAIPID